MYSNIELCILYNQILCQEERGVTLMMIFIFYFLFFLGAFIYTGFHTI